MRRNGEQSASASAGHLSKADRKLTWQLLIIAILSILFLSTGARFAERSVLEKESDLNSAHTVHLLHDNLSNLSAILKHGQMTPEDRMVLRDATEMGNVFQYKLYAPDGRIMVASHEEEIGKRNTEPYFQTIVRNDERLFEIHRRPRSGAFSDDLGIPYAKNVSVVVNRYVPIREGGRIVGVIEVYLDMTTLDERLQANSRLFLVGLLTLLASVGLACALFIRSNIREREQRLRELRAEKEQTERLRHQVNRMLENLLSAEEEKMTSILGIADGIFHEIGNPLAVLTLSIDSLESTSPESADPEFKAQVNSMREALDQVGGFLHGLSTLSVTDDLHNYKTDINVNELIRSLSGLIQLHERTRKVAFELDLSLDVAALTMPLRSVSVSIFMLLNAVAQSISEAPSRIQVSTRMSGSNDAIEIRSTAFADLESAQPPLKLDAVIEDSRPGLDTAKRIIESIGGYMAPAPEMAPSATYDFILVFPCK